MPRVAKGVPMRWMLAHVAHEGDECLVWPFAKRSDGYANLCTGPAYRVMCRLAHGEPPTTKHQAAHSCGRGGRGCINPRHLRWATRKENCADALLHGTRALGERHGAAILTEANVLKIKYLCANGMSQSEAGRRFGVAFQTIWEIVHGHNWKHLDRSCVARPPEVRGV
jgi:hypothetical protein